MSALLAAAMAPTDEAGVVAAVRAAHAAHEPLLVRGNGSKLSMLRPVRAAGVLSAAGLTGITLASELRATTSFDPIARDSARCRTCPACRTS